MSETTQEHTGNGAEQTNQEQPVRRRGRTGPRGPRAPSLPKAAFFIIQILNDNGEPIQFSKKNVKLVAVERSAEKVMELMEEGTHQYAFYLRGMVPAGRPGAPK
ncbi:MAG TPA: hypothetical protein VGN34_09455 [Ktedonobacteraceae bacterium]|jgi:hypothetical protein